MTVSVSGGTFIRKVSDNPGHHLGRAESFLDRDLVMAMNGAGSFPRFDGLTENRKFVVIDMVFNPGVRKLRRFTDTLGFIAAGDFERAAGEMCNPFGPIKWESAPNGGASTPSPPFRGERER